jgi:single-strand DNA-binding protein
MNRFHGAGNLGDRPKLKSVPLGDEIRDVLELRLYFDRPVPDGEGSYTDKGGFWLNANLWGNRAKPLSELLDKGMRVRVEGTLIQETWEDREGEERSGMKLDLDTLALELVRVASIEMRARDTAAPSDSDDPDQSPARVRGTSRKPAG